MQKWQAECFYPEPEDASDTSVRDGKPCAQLGLGCLYDTLNCMLLDAHCNKIKFNEMAVAEAQIAKVRENIVPVRPDRHYHRTKGQLADNYSNTHKRCY